MALALRLAERFSTEGPEHFGVHVLFSGSQKAMAAGTRGFITRHRGELDKESTLFVNLDEIARALRHERKEGRCRPERLRLTSSGRNLLRQTLVLEGTPRLRG